MTFDPEPLVFSGSSYIRNYNQSGFVSQINTLTGPMTNSGALGIYCQSGGGYAELDITGDLTNAVGSSLLLGSIPSGFGGPAISPQFINIGGVISGPAAVTAVGDDTVNYVYTLANNNYSGNTTVNGGTLKLGLATLAANSIVTVTNNAVLELDFTGVTNTISSLVLNGVPQSAGVYDSTTGAPYITGAGSLLVVPYAPSLSTNAYLTSLAITPAGALSPAFTTNGFTYNATNAYTSNPVTVTVSSADTNATMALTFNGTPAGTLTNGVASGNQTLLLNPPINTVAVQVVSQDLSQTNVYTVNVLLQPSLTVPKLTNSVSGSTLTLSWPADHLGYSLQAQTNALNVGLKTNWVAVPGTASVTTTNLPINKANPTVFYRLVYP